MVLDNILFEKEGFTGIITLNRPKAMNALNSQLLNELLFLLDQLAQDQEIRALIINGGPKLFAAGADIAAMVNADPYAAKQFAGTAHQVLKRIEEMEKPVIAAISGLALGGGCELALACDFRIATEESRLGFPEINLGIMPGAGGTQRLARIVGTGWAKHLILTGEPIDSATAFQIGLVTKVVKKDNLMAEAKKLADRFAAKSALALKTAKDSVRRSLDMDLDHGLIYELNSWSLLFAGPDQKEGMQAFLEKRPPEFVRV